MTPQANSVAAKVLVRPVLLKRNCGSRPSVPGQTSPGSWMNGSTGLV